MKHSVRSIQAVLGLTLEQGPGQLADSYSTLINHALATQAVLLKLQKQRVHFGPRACFDDQGKNTRLAPVSTIDGAVRHAIVTNQVLCRSHPQRKFWWLTRKLISLQNIEQFQEVVDCGFCGKNPSQILTSPPQRINTMAINGKGVRSESETGSGVVDEVEFEIDKWKWGIRREGTSDE